MNNLWYPTQYIPIIPKLIAYVSKEDPRFHSSFRKSDSDTLLAKLGTSMDKTTIVIEKAKIASLKEITCSVLTLDLECSRDLAQC